MTLILKKSPVITILLILACTLSVVTCRKNQPAPAPISQAQSEPPTDPAFQTFLNHFKPTTFPLELNVSSAFDNPTSPPEPVSTTDAQWLAGLKFADGDSQAAARSAAALQNLLHPQPVQPVAGEPPLPAPSLHYGPLLEGSPNGALVVIFIYSPSQEQCGANTLILTELVRFDNTGRVLQNYRLAQDENFADAPYTRVTNTRIVFVSPHHYELTAEQHESGSDWEDTRDTVTTTRQTANWDETGLTFQKPQSETHKKFVTTDNAELKPFLLPAMQAVTAWPIDTNGDGRNDVILGLSPATSDDALRAPRTLLILTRAEDGKLQLAARSDDFLPTQAQEAISNEFTLLAPGVLQLTFRDGNGEEETTYQATLVFEPAKNDWFVREYAITDYQACFADDCQVSSHSIRFAISANEWLAPVSFAEFKGETAGLAALDQIWRVKASKTAFYDWPDPNSKPRQDVAVKGSTVHVTGQTRHFVKATFTPPAGNTSTGYLLVQDLEPVAAPQ